MLGRAFASGVPASWVVGDSVYGDARRLRWWLEGPCVVGVGQGTCRVGGGSSGSVQFWRGLPWPAERGSARVRGFTIGSVGCPCSLRAERKLTPYRVTDMATGIGASRRARMTWVSMSTKFELDGLVPSRHLVDVVVGVVECGACGGRRGGGKKTRVAEQSVGLQSVAGLGVVAASGAGQAGSVEGLEIRRLLWRLVVLVRHGVGHGWLGAGGGGAILARCCHLVIWNYNCSTTPSA